eukprot:1159971-Pelagomonas_calceolata.AAC.6
MHTLYSNPYQLLKHPTKQKGSQIQHPQLSVVIKSRSRKGSLGLRVQASKSPTEEQQNQRIRSSKTGTIGDALEYQQQQKQPNPTDGALSKVVDGASSPGTGKSPFSSNSSFSSSIGGVRAHATNAATQLNSKPIVLHMLQMHTLCSTLSDVTIESKECQLRYLNPPAVLVAYFGVPLQTAVQTCGTHWRDLKEGA